MTVLASILWRRLDTPGHDACRLEQDGAGFVIEGAAAFRHPAGPASIIYRVGCDARWRALSGDVEGVIGLRRLDYRIARQGGVWTLNGRPAPGLDHLVDLDLGFTPATNLPPLRRVAIARGESAALPAAWLDVDAGSLSELAQSYERRSETTFWYKAPSLGYEGLLERAPDGFIRTYPGFWEAVPAA
jgi:hypothetical protein